MKGTKKEKEGLLIEALGKIGANVSTETNRTRCRNKLKVWGKNIYLINLAVRNTEINEDNSVDPQSYGFSAGLENNAIFCIPY